MNQLIYIFFWENFNPPCSSGGADLQYFMKFLAQKLPILRFESQDETPMWNYAGGVNYIQTHFQMYQDRMGVINAPARVNVYYELQSANISENESMMYIHLENGTQVQLEVNISFYWFYVRYFHICVDWSFLFVLLCWWKKQLFNGFCFAKN